jgi:MFS transporter, DHA1 family, inner membrane transport protein
MHRAQRAAIGSELPMLLVLAAINFTSVVDFLIIMPLGSQYMRLFNITSAQFG